MVSWLRGTKLRFKLEYSCHRPPLESVFLNLVISETIQWKLSRPRLFRDSNFLFLRDRDFSRLQIFKSLETETFPRLQFRVFRDRDFPRLGKSCRDQDFFETLIDLCDDVTYRCPSTVPSTKPLFHCILYSMVLTFGCKVPSRKQIFDGTVPSRKQLFDGTVPSNSFSLNCKMISVCLT